MPLSFMTDTVTVIRPALSTKNGMEYLDWTNPVTKTISRVHVVAQANAQDLGNRTLNLTDRRLLRAPFDADIQAGDHVIWHGEEYAVDGEVYHTKSPTGRISTTRCTLVRWQG